MKIDELKNEVVYRHSTSGKKGVILTLEHTYSKPSSGMFNDREVLVVDGSKKGANKLLLVVEVGEHYPDELLIQQARDFKHLPIPGKSWPLKVDRGSIGKWAPGDSGRQGERVSYPDPKTIFESHTAARPFDSNSMYQITPQVSLWSPRFFECEWSEYVIREETRLADVREKTRLENELEEAQNAKGKELILSVKDIERGVKSELPTNWELESFRGGRIMIQNEALEYLLSLIPATAK